MTPYLFITIRIGKSNPTFYIKLMKTKFIILLISCSIFTNLSFAQNGSAPPDNGTWFMYFGDNKISGNWRLFSDFQFRNVFSKQTQTQILLREGLSYRFQKEAMITAGYAYILNYPSELAVNASKTREHRIWQQFILNQWFFGEYIHIEHRYRLEQRFIKRFSEPEEDIYTNRARYRIQSRFSFGLFNPSLERFFINVNDEIFLNFGGNLSDETFDRNRAYVALGYFFTPKINLQLGYLNQIINLENRFNIDTNHNFQVLLIMNADFTRNN